ncbi:MAG: AsmA-like C-terminal region-containing protein [Candidatus Wallbacteria bacterium]
MLLRSKIKKIFFIALFSFYLSSICQSGISFAADTNNFDTNSVGISTEINNATVNIKELPFPITNISGKVKWLINGTEINDVKFKILNSDFSASGLIGKGDAPHKFKVVSEALKFEDIQKLWPVMSSIKLPGSFKFECNVSGLANNPTAEGLITMPSSKFDFGEILPQLKGIDISNISSKFKANKNIYDISDFKFNILDGIVKLGAHYNTNATSEAELSFHVSEVNAEKITKYFEQYKDKISGKINANFKVKNVLNKEKMFLDGNINFTNGTIKGLEALKKLGQAIKKDNLENLNYKKIGGNFKLFTNQKIEFNEFEVVSELLNLKTSGLIDENKNINAKLMADIAGDKLAGGLKNNKFGNILKNVIKKVKGNFNVTGTTNDPKFELMLGQ